MLWQQKEVGLPPLALFSKERQGRIDTIPPSSCLLNGFIDPTHVHERRFRQRIMHTFADFAEAADRLGKRRDLAGTVRERLGHDEWLRQEPLDTPSAGNDLFVFFAQFIDAQDG